LLEQQNFETLICALELGDLSPEARTTLTAAMDREFAFHVGSKIKCTFCTHKKKLERCAHERVEILSEEQGSGSQRE